MDRVERMAGLCDCVGARCRVVLGGDDAWSRLADDRAEVLPAMPTQNADKGGDSAVLTL